MDVYEQPNRNSYRDFPKFFRDFFDIMDILGCLWTSLDGGPAHHRINAENAYFYRSKANSILAVTQEVTHEITRKHGRFDLSQLNTGRPDWGVACRRRGPAFNIPISGDVRERSGVALSGHPLFGTPAALTVFTGSRRLSRTAA
jgi:hypothetical protein